MSVFQKLAIGSLVLSLLVAAMGQFAAVYSQRTLQEAVRRGSEIVATETMDKIDRCIQRRLEDLQVYARGRRLRQVLAESNDRFGRMTDPLEPIRRLDERWMAAPKHVLSPWMQDLLDEGLSDALRRDIEVADFYRAQYGYPLYGEIFVTNQYGANVAQTGWTSDYYQADEPWWPHARDEGTHVGDIHYDESAGVHALELAVVVSNEDGRFAGVIKAVLNVEEVVGIITNVRAASEHRSTTLDLFSPTGQTLYHAGPLAVPYTASTALLHGMARAEDGTVAFMVGAPSHGHRNFAGLGWTLRMGYDRREIFAPIARLRAVLLAFSIGVALVALLGGLLLARHIARPIGQLTETAKVISERKDYSVRASQVSDGTIGTLVEAFNTMLQQIQMHERALIAANGQLCREIAERKNAQQEQRILFDQLEQKNQELMDFAHVVSHDLKAPLRGIKMLSEWLCTDCGEQLDADARDKLHLLQGRAERMHDLIEGVLQYSRIGRIKENVVTVDLNALLPTIIDTIAPPEHITIRMDSRLPVIQCGTTRITQVFQNLLTNAVKYIDKPAGEVVVACTEDSDAWTFSVSDNGPGIEERYFERIFKIFQTLAPRDEFESTGVGLTLVKKIVEHYGGRIWVVSEVGKGSTFFFTLPKQVSCTQSLEPAEVSAS
ncbi:MAG: ATP-binding protein [Sedimentisphaerales bacterium]|jgi:signal transduction histidine kinase|nr:ATP-binding protein [Sedimentisphaerales bacterium]NLT75820.1 HAMP domain-containing protein [Planctomycetota bacterium]